MTGVESVPPVRKEITIDASQAHVFRVFSDGIDKWWPREHHIGSSPLKRAILEPRAGGRWYAECEDGTEVDTGKVLAWEPPGRLLLAWQINGEFQYDPNFSTEIEVTFTAVGPKQTRVNLEHRQLHRYGVAGPQMHAIFNADGGWGSTLAGFAKVATK